MKKPKIVCVHLLNDYSGSPRVLSQIIRSLVNEKFDVEIHTSQQKGFLSDLPGTRLHPLSYKWHNNKIITLFRFVFSQLSLFFTLLRYRNTEAIIYINTILPFGAALAAKLMNKKVIYHIHETSIRPALLKKFLFKIVAHTADDIIYVSRFLQRQETLPKVRSHVVYNSLHADFIQQAQNTPSTQTYPFTVLMLCSLKRYKGIYEFVELARMLPEYRFELVINSLQEEIDEYFKSTSLPKNLTLYPTQQNVHPFYQRAHLVLNLSHPDQWVETFGLTALEAMTYGIPVIVPPVGGIAEIVIDKKSGFKIDVRHLEVLKNMIVSVAQDENQYKLLSKGALIQAEQFSPESTDRQIRSIIENSYSHTLSNSQIETSVSYPERNGSNKRKLTTD